MRLPLRVLLAASLLLPACAAEGGDDADAASSDLNETRTHVMHGKVEDSSTGIGIWGAKVSTGFGETYTDWFGQYALEVPHDRPFFTRVSRWGYWDFVDMEIKLVKDADRLFVMPSTFAWFTSDYLVGGHDPNLGVLAVSAWSRGGCLVGDDPKVARADGATFEISSPGVDTSHVKRVYVENNVPKTSLDHAVSGSLVHALFYDVPTGVDLHVTMKNAPCRQLDYPVEWHDMIYTRGEIKVEPGNVWSFTRVWME